MRNKCLQISLFDIYNDISTSMEEKKPSKGTSYNPYISVYKTLPDFAAANSSAKQQYINGHYCYAFKEKHSEIVIKKTDNPNIDKEIGDSFL